jgi:hypothetical protein
MSIWILAIALFAIVGALGYYQGAVRLTVSLIGLFLGALLAFPLAHLAQPLVKLAGVTHPVWSFIWPPIIVFLLVLLVFMIISFFVHRKVAFYYKYRTDDLMRLRWERLNKGLGAGVGAVMAVVWLVLLSWAIYVIGHLTVQVAADESSPATIRFVNQAKRDLSETGFDKVVARFDKIAPKYYETSDLLGLVYNNPILIGRLSSYPPFLSLGERTEFQEIATDTEYNNMLLSKPDVMQIVNHPKTLAIIQNQEIMQYLRQQDLKDLRHYLETGHSPKFAEEKLLGRWELDPYATMIQARKKNPDMSASEMVRVKKIVRDYLSTVTLMATVDNKVVLKASASPDVLRPPARTNAVAAAPNPGAPAMSPEMAQRYGRGPGPANPPPQGRPAPPPQPDNTPDLNVAAQGTWQHESGDKYKLTLQNARGKEETMEAEAEEGRMVIRGGFFTLVFTKAES